MSELEWPDYLDKETGIFRYYGDNRKAGHALLDTKANGNALFEQVFAMLNGDENDWKNIPPFFIFCKGSVDYDRQFLGLAAPGNPHTSPDRNLVSFWRT